MDQIQSVERRLYLPETTTDDDRTRIRSQMYVFKDKIIMWKELPRPTPFAEDILFQKLDEITQDLSSYFLIIDITETERPGPELRDHLRQLLTARLHKIDHASVFTGKNFMLNVAAKFVLGPLGFKSFSIHKTLEEALAEIDRHAKRKTG